jgi:hypothetical protein
MEGVVSQGTSGMGCSKNEPPAQAEAQIVEDGHMVGCRTACVYRDQGLLALSAILDSDQGMWPVEPTAAPSRRGG